MNQHGGGQSDANKYAPSFLEAGRCSRNRACGRSTRRDRTSPSNEHGSSEEGRADILGPQARHRHPGVHPRLAGRADDVRAMSWQDRRPGLCLSSRRGAMDLLGI